jgi:hypothetical protein
MQLVNSSDDRSPRTLLPIPDYANAVPPNAGFWCYIQSPNTALSGRIISKGRPSRFPPVTSISFLAAETL